VDVRGIGSIAAKIGIAGAVGFGALATGMVVSRKGRNLLREAWQGRNRTTVEDRVLDELWGDRRLARREIDVEEVEPGVVLVSGVVYSDEECERCLDIVESVRGVKSILDRLEVGAPPPRRGAGALSRELFERARSGGR
jgi:hypothetical protein